MSKEQKKATKVRRWSVAWKILIPVIVIEVIVCIVMGTVLNSRMKKAMIDMGCEEATMTATYTTQKLSLVQIKTMVDGNGSTSVEKGLHDELGRCARENDTIAYLYILYAKNQKVCYVADGSDATQYGKPFEMSYQSLKTVFEGKSYTEGVIDKTSDGTLITSYVPIRDATGKQIAILGCDYNAKLIAQRICQNTLLMLIITVLCILISSLLSIIIVNGIIRNLKKVDGKINELVTSNGDLTQTIEITSGDEMELIAHHVNELLHYIREIMLNISDGSHTAVLDTKCCRKTLFGGRRYLQCVCNHGRDECSNGTDNSIAVADDGRS